MKSAGDDNQRALVAFNDGEWHHIAGVFGGPEKVLHRWGQGHDYSRGGSVTNSASPLVFNGRDKDDSPSVNVDRKASTYMDDIRIFNRALTDDEATVLSGFFVNRIEGFYGNTFSYQINATKGSDSYTVVGGALPGGLSLNTSTGLITGTPTQTGEFTADVKVSNSAGEDTKTLLFLIREGIQNLTFDQEFGTKTYGDADFDLTASSNAAGSQVVFYSKNENIVQITGNGSTVPTVTGGLKAHLQFNEGTGTTASDPLTGATGTLTNMDVADWVDGKIGKALDFDGTDDVVKLPKEIGGAKEMTVAMWIKPAGVANDFIVAKVNPDTNGNTGKGWAIRLRSDGAVWFDVGSKNYRDSNTRSAVGTYVADTWYHIAATWKNRNAKLYVNGAPVAQRTTSAGRYVSEVDTDMDR